MNKIKKELEKISGEVRVEAVTKITNEIVKSEFVITELTESALEFCRKQKLNLLLTWVEIEDIYIQTNSDIEEESNSLFDSNYSITSTSYFKNAKVHLKTKLLSNF